MRLTLLPLYAATVVAGSFALARAQAQPPKKPALPSFWQPVAASQAKRLGQPRLRPTAYRVFRLDLPGLQKVLATATEAQTGPWVLLPLPDGTLEAYQMRTTGIMAPELAARYPNLRTYAGQQTANPANGARLEITPTGVRAMLIRNGRTLFIEPYRPGDTRHYLCFDKANLPAGSKQGFEAGR
ncbi:hypothetical protein LGH70_18970 [Hymenobacter sp. BT635]|uniref:Uncharacterized protein n=1 Tax=Hymenobacter nitidus TaxID=2880929 RepID=A0ABS8AIK5_9BACT|nr:hypothetical protein [Hymenobacter nitidus]MCB2379686.1 hypothetical protein [Hymenobacter nitidus]